MVEKKAQKSVGMSISIDLGETKCMTVLNSLKPDENDEMESKCNNGILEIQVKNLKIASIYNLTDDILRCVEVSKNIVGGSL